MCPMDGTGGFLPFLKKSQQFGEPFTGSYVGMQLYNLNVLRPVSNKSLFQGSPRYTTPPHACSLYTYAHILRVWCTLYIVVKMVDTISTAPPLKIN